MSRNASGPLRNQIQRLILCTRQIKATVYHDTEPSEGSRLHGSAASTEPATASANGSTAEAVSRCMLALLPLHERS